MDEEDRMQVLRHLLSQQHAIRTVVEAASLQARLAEANDGKALALAIHVLCEDLKIYSKELSKFVTRLIGEA